MQSQLNPLLLSLKNFFVRIVNHPYTIYFLLALLVLVGLFTFSDYGISWDEDAQIAIGKSSYDYLFKGDRSLFNFCDRDYGVGFELPVYALQQFFKDAKSMYAFRHACVHFFFLLGVFFFYKSLLVIFVQNSQRYFLGLLGVLFLVLSPRLYAESYYNSKDLVLLAACCINFYTLLRCMQKPAWGPCMWHAFSTAYLIDIRIVGVMHFVLALCWLLFRILTSKEKRNEWIRMFLLFLMATPLLLYLIWPYLYEDPVHRFVQAFQNMKQFRWNFDLVFFGEVMLSSKIPWYYTLVWIGVTTPLLYLMLSLTGILSTLFRSVHSRFKEEGSLAALTALALFAGPIAATLLFHSILYDGWRQLYFVYPFLIILSVYGWYQLWSIAKPILRMALLILTSVQLLSVLFFMFQNHPYQMVYFNELPARKNQALLRNYDRDYWGLSYRQAFEHLSEVVKLPDEDTIRIVVQNIPGRFNAIFAPEPLRSRLLIYQAAEVPDIEQPKMHYFITNFRKEPKTVLDRCTQKVWSVCVQGSDLIAIYKLKGEEDCYE